VSKINSDHIRRVAIVYLRQSSMSQVRNNIESQRLQYALADRAAALGWKNVEVIDSDLGVSAAAGSRRRQGFERLLSLVALGQVGIVLSREVSRLSRNDQDWCRLLEICRVFGTLIADDDHVYDLAHMDDQLVLGIKGTLSVVELGVLRMRMQRGLESKAASGRLKLRLPTGYVYDADDHPVKSPDARTREAIALVFRRFRELQNGRQLCVWVHDQGIEMPVWQYTGGKPRVMWRPPTHLFLVGIIKNPFYAGAYVYGRRPTETVVVDAKIAKRTAKLQAAECCRVFIPDHHEAYITWEEFQENQEILRRNSPRKEGNDAVTSARSGAGLLVGLLRCGHCGRKLHVNYWGRSGTSPRYICKGEYPDVSNTCVSFAGTLVEKSVENQLLAALSPLGVEASVFARDSVCRVGEEKIGVLRHRAEQLRYEASRAFEQYDEVDPRNRLVAAELERRWNAKLTAAEEAEAALAEAQRGSAPLEAATLARLQHLGEHFEEAWHSPACSGRLKKQILRTAVREIVVRRRDRELVFVVHWAGGAHTELRFDRPAPGSHHKTSTDAIEIIRSLGPRYDDGAIAGVLNLHGLTTGQGKQWNAPRVATARRRYGIERKSTSPEALGLLGLKRAAAHCGVSQETIQKLVASGLVRNEQTIARAPYEISKADLDSEPVQRALERLRASGRLRLPRGSANDQRDLFE
jgi:DNA invertase Pin-like site-specific DNA recombinase